VVELRTRRILERVAPAQSGIPGVRGDDAIAHQGEGVVYPASIQASHKCPREGREEGQRGQCMASTLEPGKDGELLCFGRGEVCGAGGEDVGGGVEEEPVEHEGASQMGRQAIRADTRHLTLLDNLLLQPTLHHVPAQQSLRSMSQGQFNASAYLKHHQGTRGDHGLLGPRRHPATPDEEGTGPYDRQSQDASVYAMIMLHVVDALKVLQIHVAIVAKQ